MEKLHEIEVKYNDGLLSDTNDPGHIVEFSSDLFELNAYRWIEHNQMDEKKYEEIVKSLNEILQEILEG